MRKTILKLPQEVKLIWGLYKDKRVSSWRKGIALFALIYFVFPLDIIPDFIPVIGYLDDLIVLSLVGYLFVRSCPEHIVEEHRQRIAAGTSDFDQDLAQIRNKLLSKIFPFLKR